MGRVEEQLLTYDFLTVAFFYIYIYFLNYLFCFLYLNRHD